MKVGVVIITYNISSELFCLQIEAIRKYCKDDFEIVVVDNSTDAIKSTAIEYHSGLLNLLYRKTFASSMNGSDSHSFSANFSYQRLKNIYDRFIYLDHDVIPVMDFSIEEILGEDKVMAGIGQVKGDTTYFWPGLLFFNNDKIDHNLIDFNPNHQRGLDTGGNLYKVIETYGKEACVFFNESYHQNPEFIDSKYGYYSMIMDETFLHCVNSSNWSGELRHQERINSLINIIKKKIGHVE